MEWQSIELVLGPVAVDGGPRSFGHHRANAERLGAPYQTVDQRVFHDLERVAASPAQAKKPVGIKAPAVGHGQQHRP
jgi:hypothetical protein